MKDMNALKNLRSNVRRVCAERGISQRALAESSGLAYPNINRILQGKTDPSITTCEKLAEALEVPLESLILHPSDFSGKNMPVSA